MKLVTKLTLIAVMAFTLLGGATSAFAQQNVTDRADFGGVKGKVEAVGAESLTITQRNGETAIVNVTDDTRIRLVGEDGGQGTLEDIEVGNFVGARGPKNDDGSITARLVLVLPADPRDMAKVRGKVSAVEGDVIVVETRNDDTQNVTTNDETKFRIGKEPGSLEDIEAGQTIYAAGFEQDDGSILGRLVLVVTRDQVRRGALRGEVIEVDVAGGTLTVQPLNEQEKAWLVKTTEDTKYRVPDVENPTLADIETGDKVLVLGRTDDDQDNSGVARTIIVINPEHRGGRVRGEVTGIDGSSFTLQTNQRGEFTILTDDSTQYHAPGNNEVTFDDIEVGGNVFVLGKRANDQDKTIQARNVGILKRK